MIAATSHADWFNHFGLDAPEEESITAAKEKITKKRKLVTPSRVVAELTFGFWAALTAKRYAKKLWIPHLNKAFRHKQLGHGVVFQRLTSIRLLRNQIAHHECILHRDLAHDYNQIIEGTSWICPHTASWIRRSTRFEACYRYLFKEEAIR
jgi:ribosomal protein L20